MQDENSRSLNKEIAEDNEASPKSQSQPLDIVKPLRIPPSLCDFGNLFTSHISANIRANIIPVTFTAFLMHYFVFILLSVHWNSKISTDINLFHTYH